MNNSVEVVAIVEGKTEEIFVKSILAPYLATKNIFITPTQVTKPGQKGGDVTFERVKNDLEIHLKQRSDTYVTTLIDYYGTKDWPGFDKVAPNAKPKEIAETVNTAAREEVLKLFGDQRADKRFIPNMAIHEFEAYYFTDSGKLASELGIKASVVKSVLSECGEPEAINNSRETAPSKRLDKWSKRGEFPKTTTGIAIARAIGVDAIRQKCPVFNAWLQELEGLQGVRQ